LLSGARGRVQEARVKCYNHHDKEAVAICKNCHKALCDGCAADVENGIACRNSCEERVLALNALQRKGENAIKRSSRSFYGLSAFLFLTGVVFLVNFRTDDGGTETFDILLTAVFGASAVFFLVLARKAGADSR
jgi:hypothetical protein